MDFFLLIIGFLMVLLGVLGSFLPILPGPLSGWLGLLIIHFTSIIPMNYKFLGVTFAVAMIIWILDYIIPAMGTKHFGGSKYGVYGTTIGLLIGLLSPIPFGILVGAFLGAFIGELLFESKGTSSALKASFGSFIGLLASATIKFSIAFVYVLLFLIKLWEYKAAFL
jgi:uncharacterized protein YqgC (DUF456 family)